MESTHFDDQSNTLMVDVGDKAETKREAVARGGILMSSQCLEKVAQGTVAEGDVPGAARVTGTTRTKGTSGLVPLYHIPNLIKFIVDFTTKKESNEIETVCVARATGKTGTETGALTGMPVVLLTVYNICEAVDKSMEIGGIYLEYKSEGKSKEFYNPRCARNRG